MYPVGWEDISLLETQGWESPLLNIFFMRDRVSLLPTMTFIYVDMIYPELQTENPERLLFPHKSRLNSMVSNGYKVADNKLWSSVRIGLNSAFSLFLLFNPPCLFLLRIINIHNLRWYRAEGGSLAG